jgi:2-aminoadipate transaminase
MELPVQERGPDLRVLNLLNSRNRCKLVYVSPNFHNPTGQTMPLETRRQLVEIAVQLSVPVIEDDVFGQLRYDGPSRPSLQSLCPNLVVYIGSFSKMLSPGLRVGWVVAPQPVAEQLTLAKQASDLQTGLLVQAALDEFCRRGLMLRHLKRVRRIFRSRRDAMAEALHRFFPSEARWKLPEGGLSMWVTLPGDFDTEELLPLAQDRGVQFLPGAAFYFRSATANSMRLSFATEAEPAIAAGIRTLGEVISKRRPRLLNLGAWPVRERRAIV